MTTAIFVALYAIFILTIVIISFFMVTRLDAYSLDPTFTKPLIAVYITVTIVLVIINIALFTMIPHDAIFNSPPSNLYRY